VGKNRSIRWFLFRVFLDQVFCEEVFPDALKAERLAIGALDQQLTFGVDLEGFYIPDEIHQVFLLLV
jgi:hypothetical protein